MTAVANSYACVVEIGSIPISLRTCDQRFLDLLRHRYAEFLSSACPQFELDFDLTNAGSASDDDVRVRREGPLWLLERGDFQARWDPHKGCGHVRQNANPYALDSVLRIVHTLILAERGGFLLHAASAICDSAETSASSRLTADGATGVLARPMDAQAYLFSGISGAGKTTLTRLAPPDVTVLTDEISYVRPSERGYTAYGTPFAGELAKAGENCAAAVAALFFLEKGPENRIEPLSAAEAMHRLLRNILFFAEDRELVGNILATACDFVSQVPIRRLVFYPDSQVWDDIRHFEGVPALG